MGDLKINNITPSSGNIKVGNTNVSQIYCGSTLVWPLACNDVIIGTQTWTGCNLNVSTYANGDPIPQAIDDADWLSKGSVGIGAWCHYDNNPANDAIYGKLYNWHAVNNISNGGLAPAGYHIPTDAEWTTLTTYLGGESVAGGKMKSTGTIQAGNGLWESPNEAATNLSGFTGLPGGVRNSLGTFVYISELGFWWSSSEADSTSAWNRYLTQNTGDINRNNSVKGLGQSVRLIENN